LLQDEVRIHLQIMDAVTIINSVFDKLEETHLPALAIWELLSPHSFAYRLKWDPDLFHKYHRVNRKQRIRMSDLPSPFASRHSHLAETLVEHHLDALALNPGPTLTYLTGLQFHLMERPVTALFAPGKPPTIVLPELETAKIASLPFEVQAFPYGEDPATWPAVFEQAAQASSINGCKVGVEPTRMRLLEYRFLKHAASQARFLHADESLAQLRMCKDAREIAAMRRAVDIAQKALLATLPSIRPGATEKQIAAELTLQLLRAGSEPDFPFSPIVSGGPNSANPHASPTNRPLQPGDLLVIDWGAIYDAYVSDLTRTFAIGPVEDELAQIARIVLQANTAGREAAGPEIAAEEVDQAARGVIEAAGYGVYFIHRTGHGLGMEGHEPPYIRAGNTLLLQPGMTFTVEPGIYLPGRGGVRIEDNVAITADGTECLSDLPRELISLPV
jgi:Xaa-Pro aminopeptidase